jgi:hypothetical protein
MPIVGYARLTMKTTTTLLIIACLGIGASHAENWIPLFNGKDLDGWTPKFADMQVGENHHNIFRVADGILKVDYSDAEKFDGRFGHLFYKTPYSHYRIRAEIRFTGEQVPGGPEWAFRNNGLMLHSQAPETMGLEQKFPTSIEVQMSGADPGKNPQTAGRPMGCLFTPGTKVMREGKEYKGGANSASGDPMSGLEWVTVEAEVRGGEEIIHFVNGNEVLRYQNTMLQDGTPLTSGYIAIQAETHNTDFRKIELMPLPGNKSVPNGMTSLFDGKSLDGWKLGPKSEGHWKVVDGVIDYDALAGEHLWTEESFGDFELHVDWRIKETHGLYPVPTVLPDGSHKKGPDGKDIITPTPNADSGILLRGEMKSQCNIWCWPIGSGEVYGYRMDRNMPPEVRAGVTPKVRADNPVGEWNRFIIRMVGDRLTVNLNGQTVIDNAQLPGIPASGPIGFQHHGGLEKDGTYNNASSLMQFRNVFIKKL